jgi:hypothetical protein
VLLLYGMAPSSPIPLIREKNGPADFGIYGLNWLNSKPLIWSLLTAQILPHLLNKTLPFATIIFVGSIYLTVMRNTYIYILFDEKYRNHHCVTQTVRYERGRVGCAYSIIRCISRLGEKADDDKNMMYKHRNQYEHKEIYRDWTVTDLCYRSGISSTWFQCLSHHKSAF